MLGRREEIGRLQLQFRASIATGTYVAAGSSLPVEVARLMHELKQVEA